MRNSNPKVNFFLFSSILLKPKPLKSWKTVRKLFEIVIRKSRKFFKFHG